jgi:2-polyprenyl-3-methyl-5-hydroxy-6-metoxy-1,4-benzoquinol methylase
MLPFSSNSAPLPCDLCSSTDTEVLAERDRDGKPLRTVICRNCGLVFSDPRPDNEAVREYYLKNYRADYKAVHQPKTKHVYRAGKVAAERITNLKKWLKPGQKVLDFGAGGGEVLFALLAMGCDATGFEPNEGYALFAAQDLGLPVTHSFYQDANIREGSLDAVTSFHVYEHLDSPSDAARHVAKWLKPGGHFIVEVPNVEATCQWPGHRFHRAHLFNFNPSTLESLGKAAGLEVVHSHVSSDGGNIGSIFRKPETPSSTPASRAIPGNYQRVKRIVDGHTNLGHLFSPYPYIRPFRSLARALDEKRGCAGNPSPKEILKATTQCLTTGM